VIARRPALLRSGAILAAFVAVLLLCAFQGPRHRRYAGPPGVRTAPSHLAAFREWEREGVKGRVLCLFDRRAFLSDKGEVPTEENYLDLAVRRGIVRRIYHFVPSAAWPEVEAKLRADDRFRFEGGGFVHFMEEGRLFVTTIENVPQFEERALVLVNPASWSGQELVHVGHILRDHGIDSDLAIVVSPNGFAFPEG
jgi:hypothetical protein